MMQKITILLNKNFILIPDSLLNFNFKKIDNWLEKKEQIGRYILELLYDCGAIKTWFRDKKEGWILNSRLWSPVYISLRDISSKKNGASILEAIGKALSLLIINEIFKFDKILGLATTGTQIATVITLFSKIPSLYNRKIVNGREFKDFEDFIKTYGEHRLIEGEFEDGETIILVDDLVTKFKSVHLVKKQLIYEAKQRNKKVICNDVVVLIDREQGAQEKAKELGYNLYSLIPFKSKLHWLEDKFDPQEYSIIRDYFKDYSKFQEKDKIKEIISLARLKK